MSRARVLVGLALLVASPACSKKPDAAAAAAKAAAVAGLSAVPVDATTVISIDLTRVRNSPLVQRGVDSVIGRSPGLRERWTNLAQTCQLGLGAELRRVVIALGPAGTPAAPQPVLLVVLGSADEASFTACVRGVVGGGSGAVSAQASAQGGSAAGSAVTSQLSGGRTIYRVDDPGRQVWFTFGQADTMVLSTSESWLEAGVGVGAKVGTDPGWQALVGHADQGAPIWAAGAVPERVGARLVEFTSGAVAAGPRQFVGSLDPATGAAVELGAVMATAGDAQALFDLGQAQLMLGEKVAQRWGLGTLVAKVKGRLDGTVYRIGAGLSPDEVKQVLMVIDTPGASPQDARP